MKLLDFRSMLHTKDKTYLIYMTAETSIGKYKIHKRIGHLVKIQCYFFKNKIGEAEKEIDAIKICQSHYLKMIKGVFIDVLYLIENLEEK